MARISKPQKIAGASGGGGCLIGLRSITTIKICTPVSLDLDPVGMVRPKDKRVQYVSLL